MAMPPSVMSSLTFDSTSSMLDERKKSIFLTIQRNLRPQQGLRPGGPRCQDQAEAWRTPLRIDLAFSNDF